MLFDADLVVPTRELSTVLGYLARAIQHQAATASSQAASSVAGASTSSKPAARYQSRKSTQASNRSQHRKHSNSSSSKPLDLTIHQQDQHQGQQQPQALAGPELQASTPVSEDAAVTNWLAIAAAAAAAAAANVTREELASTNPNSGVRSSAVKQLPNKSLLLESLSSCPQERQQQSILKQAFLLDSKLASDTKPASLQAPPPPSDNKLADEAISNATPTSTTSTARRPAKCNGTTKRHRAHKCGECGHIFARSDMLSRHSRLHSGLKPYQCSRCAQVFSRSDHLATHERTHTGEKPYQCHLCAYSACRRDMITRHMRTHAPASDARRHTVRPRAPKRNLKALLASEKKRKPATTPATTSPAIASNKHHSYEQQHQ